VRNLQAAQAEIADSIASKMMGVLECYSRENGYIVVLDSSSGQNSLIAYRASNIEVAKDIIGSYDQAYPVGQ
jgi:hypothetical protein